MTMHTLKLNDRFFDAVLNGTKTFEIRKNDRDFRVGDYLIMTRVNDEGVPVFENSEPQYLGMRWKLPFELEHIYVIVKVTYILTHDDFPAGIPEGYVVMSIVRVRKDE